MTKSSFSSYPCCRIAGSTPTEAEVNATTKARRDGKTHCLTPAQMTAVLTIILFAAALTCHLMQLGSIATIVFGGAGGTALVITLALKYCQREGADAPPVAAPATTTYATDNLNRSSAPAAEKDDDKEIGGGGGGGGSAQSSTSSVDDKKDKNPDTTTPNNNPNGDKKPPASPAQSTSGGAPTTTNTAAAVVTATPSSTAKDKPKSKTDGDVTPPNDETDEHALAAAPLIEKINANVKLEIESYIQTNFSTAKGLVGEIVDYAIQNKGNPSIVSGSMTALSKMKALGVSVSAEVSSKVNGLQKKDNAIKTRLKAALAIS